MNKHNNQKSDKQLNCEALIASLQMMKATGAIHKPALRNLWHISTSPLGKGRYAAEAAARLNNIVGPMFIAQQFRPRPPPRIPAVPAKYAILLGYEVGTGRPVVIHRNSLIHTLIVGATNTGKSRLMYSIVDQVMRQNKTSEADHE